MRLSELKSEGEVLAPASAAVETERSASPSEPEYFTSVTPSGIEVAYSPAPRRHYRLRGPHPKGWEYEGGWTEVPSVTNVLGVLDKSGPLVWWAQRIGVAGVIELLQTGKLKHRDLLAAEAQDVVDLLTEHRLSVNHVKDSAADRGVNVHGALEAWADGKPIAGPDEWPEHERGYVQGLLNFILAVDKGMTGNAAIESELMVGSLEHQYAGRFDLVLTLSKPVEVVTKCYPKRPSKVEEIPAGRYLLDLKTSKGVYNTHFLQLEAYEAAAVECGYHPTDHRGVIHVTADGRYELVLNKDWIFEDFLAVRNVYTVLNQREVLRAAREELGAKEVS